MIFKEVFEDLPEVSKEDYKIPNGIDPEFMTTLWTSAWDRRLHDYLILVWCKKFSAVQINRMLYLSKFWALRLRKKLWEKLNEWEKYKKGCEN